MAKEKSLRRSKLLQNLELKKYNKVVSDFMFFSLQIFCLTKQGKLITLIVAVLVAPVAGCHHMTTLAHCGTKIKGKPSNFYLLHQSKMSAT